MIRNQDILIFVLVLFIVFVNLSLFVVCLKNKAIRKYLVGSVVISFIVGLFIVSNNYSRIKYWIDKYRIENNELQTSSSNKSCSCTSKSLHFQKDSYSSKHRPMAKKVTGDRFIEDKAKLKEYLQENQLVPISDCKGYHIQRLGHSSKHLTPLAKQRLEELGSLFRKNLKGTLDAKSYFLVSSVTRTEAQQCKIRKAYPGSATLKKSTHSYGVSVDISRVMYKKSCRKSLKALEKAIDEMQGEGKLLICPEKGCIHLTFV